VGCVVEEEFDYDGWVDFHVMDGVNMAKSEIMARG
jgi:hypothetical protein